MKDLVPSKKGKEKEKDVFLPLGKGMSRCDVGVATAILKLRDGNLGNTANTMRKANRSYGEKLGP